MKPLFAANWKMNMLREEAEAFMRSFKELFTPLDNGSVDAVIAPPCTCLDTVGREAAKITGLALGAQNVHWEKSGAHTGEVSPLMLVECGVSYVIVGHSERRQFYGESDAAVALRAKAAIEQTLTAIVCIGETKKQFEAGKTSEVVHRQICASLNGLTAKEHAANLIVAYEPIWAIGTGLAATPEIAGGVHSQIRDELAELFGSAAGAKVPILYGGSTKPENITELCAQTHINGALVGGASLKAESFNKLIENGRLAAS